MLFRSWLPYSRPLARIAGQLRTDAELCYLSLFLTRAGVEHRIDCSLARDGAFLARALPPGTYGIAIAADGCPRADLGTVELAPGSVHQLGVVRLERAPAADCTLRVLVEGPRDGYMLVLMRDDGTFVNTAAVSEGEASFGALTPGSYLAATWSSEMALVSEPVVLAPASATTCQLVIPFGRAVALRPDPSPEDPGVLRMEWRTASGTLLWVDAAGRWSRADLENWVVRLAPGAYRLAISGSEGRSTTTPLVVGAEPSQELRVQFP